MNACRTSDVVLVCCPAEIFQRTLLLSLAILSHLSRSHPPAVGTNCLSNVDVPLNTKQTNKQKLLTGVERIVLTLEVCVQSIPKSGDGSSLTKLNAFLTGWSSGVIMGVMNCWSPCTMDYQRQTMKFSLYYYYYYNHHTAGNKCTHTRKRNCYGNPSWKPVIDLYRQLRSDIDKHSLLTY